MLNLTSSAFKSGESIPSKYTCDGDNISPPLSISEVPDGTESLALLMDDPDIPEEIKKSRGIEVFDHWVIFNIPPETTEINEGEAPGTEGLNSGGEEGYTGPCPPKEHEPKEHRYNFTLYALNKSLDLESGVRKEEVVATLEEHILEETTLTGLYEKK